MPREDARLWIEWPPSEFGSIVGCGWCSWTAGPFDDTEHARDRLRFHWAANHVTVGPVPRIWKTTETGCSTPGCKRPRHYATLCRACYQRLRYVSVKAAA